MKRLLQESHLGRRLASLCKLGLLFSLLISYGLSAAHGQSQAAWRFKVEERESKLDTLPLTNECKAPHLYRVKSGERFLRFEEPTESILIGPGLTNPLRVRLDATKLKPKVYRAKVDVECLDCKQDPKCGYKQSKLIIEVTVVKAASQNGDRKADPQRIKARLDHDLALLSRQFEEMILKLVVMKGSLPGGKIVEGFDADAVMAAIRNTYEALLAALGREEELDALKAYVIKNYPGKPSLTTVLIKRVKVPALPKSKSRSMPFAFRLDADGEALDEQTIVTPESANKAFNNVRAFLAMLTQNSKSITLRVISEPEEANIVLISPGGKRVESITNSDIKEFWRGTYSFKVTKTGFLTIEQTNQDFGFGVSVLECKLVTSGEPLFCKLR